VSLLDLDRTQMLECARLLSAIRSNVEALFRVLNRRAPAKWIDPLCTGGRAVAYFGALRSELDNVWIGRGMGEVVDENGVSRPSPFFGQFSESRLIDMMLGEDLEARCVEAQTNGVHGDRVAVRRAPEPNDTPCDCDGDHRPGCQYSDVDWLGRKKNPKDPDLVASFVDARLRRSLDAKPTTNGDWSGAQPLYDEYRRWVDATGHRPPLAINKFTARLVSLGVARHVTKRGSFYAVRLAANEASEPPF
jgi:hypothetical protein